MHGTRVYLARQVKLVVLVQVATQAYLTGALVPPSHVRPVLSKLYTAARMDGETPLATHSADLRDRGFTVMDSPVISSALVENARGMIQARLSQLLLDVEAVGCNRFEQQYIFSEIVHRQRKRWDLQLAESSGEFNMLPASSITDDDSGKEGIWHELFSTVLSAVMPIVQESQGAAFTGMEAVKIGAVISRRGARVQVLGVGMHELSASRQGKMNYFTHPILMLTALCRDFTAMQTIKCLQPVSKV